MVCPHCRAENAESASFCSSCGTGLVSPRPEHASAADNPTTPYNLQVQPKPLAAVGIATPPPDSGSGLETRADLTASLTNLPIGTLAPGNEFGPRYRIEALLGQGGMGAVYKAYDRELNRVVALKLVRPELTADPTIMQRFKQELLLASRISHKNILRIHDLGAVERVKFISMAYVEGKDLHHLLAQHGRLPLARALSIARQICAALEAAHAEGVVHRDLKPQNILIDASDHAYVSDFGLAKSLEEGAALMTRTGEVLGTPRYMSPEQVEGKPAGPRSDLYALGLILYEMVTGAAAFEGDSSFQIMYQRVAHRPKSPKEINPDLPDYLVRIILRCLEPKPEQRYQEAREVLRDLESKTAPVTARSVRVSLPLPARNVWLWGGGALLALLLLVLVVAPVRHFLFRSARPAVAGIPPLAQGKYIAVLPFRVLGDQESLGYIAQGLGEALSAKLFQLRDVHVSSPSAAEKANPKDSQEKIARDLGANLLVRGTVQGGALSGVVQKIAVIVTLDDVSTGRVLWSGEVSGVVQDLLTLEDRVSSKLVSALELKPSDSELARAAAHPTENFEAYDLYLKGRNAFRSQHGAKDIQSAIDYFNAALGKDPSFALAYTGLADASLAMYAVSKDAFWEQKALRAAQQARELNDQLAEVHFALGSIYKATGRGAESIAELNRALQLSPNSDDGYRRLGSAYLANGRTAEALKSYQKAVDLNPYYWSNYNALGNAYFNIGESEKALAAYQKVTELEPDNSIGYMNIGAVYFRQGKYEDSIPFMQKALKLQPEADLYSNLGTAYFFLKRYQEAVGMFEKAAQMSPNDSLIAGNLADAYRWSGHTEQAQSTYEKAIALAYKELQVNPRDADALSSLGMYYAKKGDPAEALQFSRRARSLDPGNIQFIYNEAEVRALAGQPAEALKCLKESFQKGYSPEEARNDPELKKLEGLPEYDRLLKEYATKK